MTLFRKAVAWLTLVALVGNSAAASLRPCCCTERQQPQKKPAHACCEQTAADKSLHTAEVERAACCVSRAAAEESVPPLRAIGENPCCCVTSLPATPPTRETFTSRSLSPVEYGWVGDGLRLADFPPAKQRILQNEPGLLFPAAPSLCVLYCTWLK